jgi:hypothetical protein
MTSLAHHAPRLGINAAPATGRNLVVVKAGGHPWVAVAIVAVVACLLAGAILTLAAGIDTHGRIPHPVPLPAPTSRAIAGS